jgi:hypothetical protein
MSAPPTNRFQVAVLGLWAYSALSGALAVGVGQMMVSVTRGVVPTLPVRLGSLIAVVVVAGLAAEHMLGHFRRLVGLTISNADGASHDS